MWGIIAISTFVAGMIQTITGFGAGILIMVVLSSHFDMLVSPAINTSICLSITLMLAWKNRKKIHPKLIAAPTVVYAVTSGSMIYVAEHIALDAIAIGFSLFLSVLSFYFLFFSNQIHLRPSVSTAVACSLFSGVFSGLFGVGGPVLGLYLIAITKSHEEYLGNIQFVFSVINIVNLLVRIGRGIYTVEYLPITVIGVCGILLGAKVGTRVYRKLNPAMLKKLVYIYVGTYGIVTLCQHSGIISYI